MTIVVDDFVCPGLSDYLHLTGVALAGDVALETILISALFFAYLTVPPQSLKTLRLQLIIEIWQEFKSVLSGPIYKDGLWNGFEIFQCTKGKYDLHLVDPTSALGMIERCQQQISDAAVSRKVNE